MENEDLTDIFHQDADMIDNFCSNKNRFVKKTVAKILHCEDRKEKRDKMHFLSGILSRIEACSAYDEEDTSCAHCRQINTFRRRMLDLSIDYDSKLTRIGERLEVVVDNVCKPAIPNVNVNVS